LLNGGLDARRLTGGSILLDEVKDDVPTNSATSTMRTLNGPVKADRRRGAEARRPAG
jgi:hypothetical protein